jgi:hypothetical protein
MAIAFVVAVAARAGKASDERQILKLEDVGASYSNKRSISPGQIVAPSFTFIKPDAPNNAKEALPIPCSLERNMDERQRELARLTSRATPVNRNWDAGFVIPK